MNTDVGDLDEAWKAVEAVLPEGWSLWWLNRDKDEGWDATAGWDGAKNPAEAKVAYATGPTPALALQALASKLRAEK